MFLSDQDDRVTPVSIEHGIDAMMTEDGQAFEFYYNFLIYTFRQGDETLVAKHYLDQPGEVSLTPLPSSDLNTSFAKGVLLYLAMRYSRITTLGEHGTAPLTAALLSELADAVRAAFR